MPRRLDRKALALTCLSGLFAGMGYWTVATAQGPSLDLSLSTDLTITSPPDATVVAPGDTVPVDVSVVSGASFTQVGLVVQDVGLGPYATKSAPPYEFEVRIPSDLIGPKKITAFGMTGPGAGVFSAPITVDIETSSPIKTLSVSPRKIFFDYAGQQIPIQVTGSFANASSLDITHSSKITYKSGDPTTATVNSAGLVTAAGVGSTGATTIIVTYGSHSVGIPVSVKSAIRGDLTGDGIVGKDDLNELLAWLGTRATTPNDARDLNHDGVINALDARILATLCARPGCATQAP